MDELLSSVERLPLNEEIDSFGQVKEQAWASFKLPDFGARSWPFMTNISDT